MSRLTKTLVLSCAVVFMLSQPLQATKSTGSQTTPNVYTTSNVGPVGLPSTAASIPAPAPVQLTTLPVTRPSLATAPTPAGSVPMVDPATSRAVAPSLGTPPIAEDVPGAENPYQSLSHSQPTVSGTTNGTSSTAMPTTQIPDPSVPSPQLSGNSATGTPSATSPFVVVSTANGSAPATSNGQEINAIANIDPSRRGVSKSEVKTTVGDAKIKAKAVVINTKHGTKTKTKVKVHGELPPGVSVNAIVNSGNATLAKSSAGGNK